MPGRLAGRVAVVIGAASGIGAAISVAFAQEGAQVALVDLAEPAAAEPVLAAVRGHDRQAVYVQTDVADEQAVGDVGLCWRTSAGWMCWSTTPVSSPSRWSRTCRSPIGTGCSLSACAGLSVHPRPARADA